MRISIVGTGRVAHHLVKVLYAMNEHEIVQIYGRQLGQAQHLAPYVAVGVTDQIDTLQSDIDVLIIAVSDQSIAQVIQNLHCHLPDVLIVHTSGSTDLDVLLQHHARSGVFYPLQTFSFERNIDWHTTPIFVEAINYNDLALLTELAKSLSERVYQYSSAQRLSLHLAAVFACNFTNYCYDMAQQIVDAKHVDFNLLYPLILETAQKATQQVPKHMQTGPAMRGDQNILTMHQEMLKQEKRQDLEQVYQLLSEQILQRHQN